MWLLYLCGGAMVAVSSGVLDDGDFSCVIGTEVRAELHCMVTWARGRLACIPLFVSQGGLAWGYQKALRLGSTRLHTDCPRAWDLRSPWGTRSKNTCKSYGKRVHVVLGPSWGYLGAILASSWAILGPSLGILKPSWAILGRSWGHLGPSWGHLGLSWGYLGAILGHLGAILGPSGPILVPS